MNNPKSIEDLRKISSTSEFSKLFEGFLKEWIIEDISPNIDPSQFGNQPGTGTDHMMVVFLDKIRSMLDESDGHGGFGYLVNSNDNTDFLEDDEKFKYVDDLSMLEFVCLTGLLCEYNFKLNVASDIGIDSYLLPPANIEMQDFLNQVDSWTDENQMVWNIKKTKYIIFNTAQADFNTRLKIKDINIEQAHEARVLGGYMQKSICPNLNAN